GAAADPVGGGRPAVRLEAQPVEARPAGRVLPVRLAGGGAGAAHFPRPSQLRTILPADRTVPGDSGLRRTVRRRPDGGNRQTALAGGDIVRPGLPGSREVALRQPYRLRLARSGGNRAKGRRGDAARWHDPGGRADILRIAPP